MYRVAFALSVYIDNDKHDIIYIVIVFAIQIGQKIRYLFIVIIFIVVVIVIIVITIAIIRLLLL